MTSSLHAELGLVLCGTASVPNLRNTSADSTQHTNLVVAHPVAPTTVEFLSPLHQVLARTSRRDPEQPQSSATCDVLETLTVCTSLLQQRTLNKKYVRTVYLITDARDEVKHKESLPDIITTMKEAAITLVVVAIDFSEASPALDAEWAGLPVKAQNERVLLFLTAVLTESSEVITLKEAMARARAPRPRTVTQRQWMKTVVMIGDIQLAVQLYIHVQEAKLPSVKRMTVSGEPVVAVTDYVRVMEGDREPVPVAASELTKAYCCGRSVIPCSSDALEAMRLRGPRRLEALGFVGLHEVPPTILMGGVKVALPVAGDRAGQKGFSSFVRAMAQTGKAMIVRLVRAEDVSPVLYICVPSCHARQELMYLAPLPYAEDVRQYRFSEYEDVQCSTEEDALVTQMVDELTIKSDAAQSTAVRNPLLQQYDALLQRKILECFDETDAALHDTSLSELLQHVRPACDVPHMFGAEVHARLRMAQDTLAACAKAFPYSTPPRPSGSSELQRAFLVRSTGENEAGSDEAEGETSSTTAAPSTVAADLAIALRHTPLPQSSAVAAIETAGDASKEKSPRSQAAQNKLAENFLNPHKHVTSL